LNKHHLFTSVQSVIMPQEEKLALVQAEMDLFLEALKKNDRLFVRNHGNGMRNLFYAGDFIGVIDAEAQVLETGRIVLGRNEKFFSGARILSGNDQDGWKIKTDCGYGKTRTMAREDILAVVDSFQVGGQIYLLWHDQRSKELNKKIAVLSGYVLPVSPFVFLSYIKRKIYKWRVRKTQLLLKNHIARTQQPLPCSQI